ncbi:notch-regulated ankyrin repeat-containing protein-like [Glandiceps talaboti]
MTAHIQSPYQQVFQEAVKNGDTNELARLLETSRQDVNVNSYDCEGQTALHQSVLDGNLELVKVLVRFGADVKLANRDGWNALHIAAYGGHEDIALYLIAYLNNCKR